MKIQTSMLQGQTFKLKATQIQHGQAASLKATAQPDNKGNKCRPK